MTSPPPAASPRELTFRVVLLGLVLSVVMGAANVYVGLKVGMTVSASIPAAAVAMLIFRAMGSGSSLLEANQVQTSASAGESLAAGIIFTMPALLLMGVWQEFDYWTVTGVAFAGGLLGILFMIPMRRVFVVDNSELPYPEGVACAAVLETGSAEGGDAAGARALLLGGLLGGVFKLFEGFFHLLHGTMAAATRAGERVLYFGSDVSPMLVAVGLIVRLNVAVLIFIGGALSWLIGIPLLGIPEGTAPDADAVGIAEGLWSSKMRFVGVGAMVVGGIASIVAVRAGLARAVTELRRGLGGSGTHDDGSRDLPSGVIVILGIVSIALVAGIYYRFTGGVGITAVSTVVMVVMSFFFTAVASYIVGIVGNSNSPVSGMTITAVLFTGAMLWVFGYAEGTAGMVSIIGVAAVVCCVACTSGDVCNDLKTGSLVGASPYRQQIMQVLGVAVGSLVMAPVMTLLHENTEGGIGGPELSAPQAGLFKSLAEGFSGRGQLEWTMLAIGAVVGVLFLVADAPLRARKAHFRLHLMPIAVGMYLPFGLAVPILLGGLIAHFAVRGARSPEEQERALHRGVLFSSGVIAGEALTKVGLAGLAAVGITAFDWSLVGLAPAHGLVTALSLAASAAMLVAFALMARGRSS